MNLPEMPSTFRQPSPADRPWWWRLEAADGSVLEIDHELADERFANQGDAESWIGEAYGELSDLGVVQVTLFELDREVYGPMGLSA